eukprot:CAMPEP_0174307094 /NCGR_PEP_ID=MMETSP0810-20121108/895_1 /TAXON_ID=73025 ORGANISM="Eutreptiella gymnastica-like, Strain CCMP1594" /NCGR_SAMPLE_ID=MMETSP0810 /ASSEMBLY_ACC=CAM_ASM_000659 /LENGTH=95 /DNA_ID=CAMNT_0015414041 /DNA_START=1329 /DNA_END=1617 /DNA_ORIENTATION=+
MGSYLGGCEEAAAELVAGTELYPSLALRQELQAWQGCQASQAAQHWEGIGYTKRSGNAAAPAPATAHAVPVIGLPATVFATKAISCLSLDDEGGL